MLNGLTLWEMQFIHAIMALGAWLEAPMRAFTAMGQEEFFLAVMPLIFWCLSLSKPLGTDLALLLFFSSTFNSAAKALLKQPRPYWIEAGLNRATETSFGIPSGHAMNAVSLWGYLAWRIRTGWRWLAVAVILLISFSRLYLGMHFVRDILGGWLLGMLVLGLFVWLKPRVLPRLKKLSLTGHVVGAVLAAAVVFGLYVLAIMVTAGDRSINPAQFDVAIADAWTNAGTCAGMAWGLWIGLALEWRYVHFATAGAPLQRGLRYLLGMAGLLALWYGLKLLFPAGTDPLALALRIVRYGLMMIWTVAAWPWLFIRLGLGQAETRPGRQPAGRKAGAGRPSGGRKPRPAAGKPRRAL